MQNERHITEFLSILGHAVSMINADQYRSMPDQIGGIDPKFIDRHWCQCHTFDRASIGIDRH